MWMDVSVSLIFVEICRSGAVRYRFRSLYNLHILPILFILLSFDSRSDLRSRNMLNNSSKLPADDGLNLDAEQIESNWNQVTDR